MLAKSASEFEFRVLTGWHAGAMVPVAAGDTLTLGPEQDAEAALVLSDLPADAGGELVCASDGWQWARNGHSVKLACGEGLRLGEVIVTMDVSHHPWPDPRRIVLRDGYEPPPTDEARGVGETEAAQAQGDQTDGVAADGTTAVSAAPATPAEPPAMPAPEPKSRSAPWIGVGFAVGFALVAIVMLAGRLIDWATPPPPPPAAAPPQLNVAELEALVAALPIDARLSVLASDSGGLPRLEGVVAADEDVELLMNALARLAQRPLIRILTTEDLLAQAQALVETIEPALAAESEAVGTLIIDGVASSDRTIASLFDRLRMALPTGVEISDRSLRQDEVNQWLLRSLRERSLPEFDLAWENGQLKLKGRLEEPDVPVWEQALIDFAGVYGERVRFQARVDMPSPAVFLRRQVRTVVSGPAPYLLLHNGQKVMTGGRLGNYRLLEIRDSLLVWEWVGGRSFAIER